jgi:hypothetical protein
VHAYADTAPNKLLFTGGNVHWEACARGMLVETGTPRHILVSNEHVYIPLMKGALGVPIYMRTPESANLFGNALLV